MSSNEGTETTLRLLRIDDQLCVLMVLVQADAPCAKVLDQLCKLRIELRSLRNYLINCQVNSSKNVIRNHPCVDSRIAEIRQLVELYKIKIQSS